MKCIIPGPNVKVFGKSIHSLSKIGEELYLEPLEHGLALRTVNSSRSAYACFIFAPSFFQHYDDGSGQIHTADAEDEVIKCKIGMKSCLTVFKSLTILEKTVDKCKITLNMQDARLVFQLHCRHGIVKTHNLSFIECETLQAVFSKDACPNVLVTPSRLLSDVVMSFQTSQEEVTMVVTKEKVTFRNYTEDEPDPSKVVHTELSLDADEFDSYQVGVENDVTFCLKELRAILGFSDIGNHTLSLHFESPGKPIVFAIDSDPTFEANFVLATLADRSSQASCSQQSTTSQMRSQTTALPGRSQHSTKKQPAAAADSGNRPSTSGSHSDLTDKPNASRQKDRQNPGKDRQNPGTSTSAARNRNGHKSTAARFDAAYQELMNDDMDDVIMEQANQLSDKDGQSANESHGNKGHGQSSTADRSKLPVEDMSDSPVIPYQSTKPKESTRDIGGGDGAVVAADSDVEEEDDFVPGTPPSKKFKSMFVGFSQSTTGGSQPPPTILAEDTDDDD